MAVVESWDTHVLVIDKVVPQNWRVSLACLFLTSHAFFELEFLGEKAIIF